MSILNIPPTAAAAPGIKGRGIAAAAHLLEDGKITTNASPEIKTMTRPIIHFPIPQRDACYIANEYIAKAMCCQPTEPLHPPKPKLTLDHRFTAYCRRLHRQTPSSTTSHLHHRHQHLHLLHRHRRLELRRSPRNALSQLPLARPPFAHGRHRTPPRTQQPPM